VDVGTSAARSATCQASAPPPGSVEVRTCPSKLTATQSCLLGQSTLRSWRPLKKPPGLGAAPAPAWTTFQLPVPPLGSVEEAIVLLPPTAMQNEGVGQEMPNTASCPASPARSLTVQVEPFAGVAAPAIDAQHPARSRAVANHLVLKNRFATFPPRSASVSRCNRWLREKLRNKDGRWFYPGQISSRQLADRRGIPLMCG
jgi:hypothetical protein